ncbi:PE family protein, partial [Mycobacterium gordonae]
MIIRPESLRSAAGDIATLGRVADEAGAVAATRTTGLVAAAADEVSVAIAELFNGHGLAYQSASVQAAAFQERLVASLNATAGAYAGAEAVNVATLQRAGQELLRLINAPTVALVGRPLIGDGADGAAGSGQNGAAGGLLWG